MKFFTVRFYPTRVLGARIDSFFCRKVAEALTKMAAHYEWGEEVLRIQINWINECKCHHLSLLWRRFTPFKELHCEVDELFSGIPLEDGEEYILSMLPIRT